MPQDVPTVCREQGPLDPRQTVVLGKGTGQGPEPKGTRNTRRYLMPYRYAKLSARNTTCTNTLILLARVDVVPVVGLEPTRLFKAPGF